MNILKSWFSKSKMLVCILTALVLAFLFCMQNALGNHVQGTKKYTISVTSEKNTLSKGSEARITSISISEINVDLSDPSSFVEYLDTKYSGQYIDGMLVFYPNGSVISLDVNVPFGQTFTIEWLKHPWSGIVHIYDGETDDEIDLYSESATVTTSIMANTSIDYIKMLENYSINFGEYILSFVICLACVIAISLTIWAVNNYKFRFFLIPVLMMALFILGVNTLYFITFVSPIIAVCAIVLTLAYLCFRTRNVLFQNIESAYAIFISVFGIAFLLMIPIGHVPDEFAHQAKTYAIAEDYYNVDEYGYVYIPAGEQQLLEYYSENVGSYNINYSPTEMIKFLKAEPDSMDDHSASFSIGNTLGLCDFSYYPATIPVLIAKVIPLNAAMIFLLGRLINLFIASMLIYTAIKITPSYKRIFALVALFPVTVQQTAAINQDWITNALVFLLLAEVLSVALNNAIVKISKRKLVVISIIAFCLVFVKSGFWLAAFLILLIPAAKFGGIKKKYLYFTALIAIIFGLFVFVFFSEGFTLTSTADTGKYTFGDILSDPINFIISCYNTFLGRGLLDGLDGLLTGFGWSTKWSSGFVRSFMFISASILIVGDVEKRHCISLRQRMVLVLTALMISGMIYAAMYTWTYIGQTSIDGLQCRYFIPANLIAYIAISNRKINISVKNPNKLFMSFSAIFLTVGIYDICTGFYV